MRYLYARFEGYIGFYTGLGLTKLEIDFTKFVKGIFVLYLYFYKIKQLI